MKKFLIAASAFFLLTLSVAFTTPTVTNVDVPGKKIQILFNPNTGFTELGLIQAACDKQGIHITYKKIEFDETGKLKSLSFRVDCNDGFSGSASTDRLSNDSRFGFFRDYSENTKIPFAVGAITAE